MPKERWSCFPLQATLPLSDSLSFLPASFRVFYPFCEHHTHTCTKKQTDGETVKGHTLMSARMCACAWRAKRGSRKAFSSSSFSLRSLERGTGSERGGGRNGENRSALLSSALYDCVDLRTDELSIRLFLPHTEKGREREKQTKEHTRERECYGCPCRKKEKERKRKGKREGRVREEERVRRGKLIPIDPSSKKKRSCFKHSLTLQ